MFDLEKLKDNDAIFWTFQWPKIREVAAKCGWAVAIHGSVVHDLDLMAMPWVKNHVPADNLAACIASVVCSDWREPFKNDTDKPNNRVVYTIFAATSYIDLNVIKEPEEGYKVLEKNTYREIKTEQTIGIQNKMITFQRGFVNKYGIKPYCVLSKNDADCLCFKLTDIKESESYVVTHTKQDAYVIHTPRFIQERVIDWGRYPVEKDGEWFVTNCKLK